MNRPAVVREWLHIDTTGLYPGAQLWYREQWFTVLELGRGEVLVVPTAVHTGPTPPASYRGPQAPGNLGSLPTPYPARKNGPAARLGRLLGRYGWELRVLGLLALMLALAAGLR